MTTEHVEYDDDQPKRRPLMFVGIAIAVVLVALGIGWLIVSDMEADDGDIAKVTRAQKGPDVDYDADEPEPQPEPEDEVDETPIPVVKKKAPPKRAMTFEQSLAAMKGRIRNNCAKVGPGPVQLDTLALKTGGSAIAPKIKPKGPVGDCARRIVENWKFPASDKDHAIKGQVRLR